MVKEGRVCLRKPGTNVTDEKETTEVKAVDYCIIIMCAGIGQRWGTTFPKQLSIVQGKPNLVRTIDLLKEMVVPDDNIIVTVNQENAKHFPTSLNLYKVDTSTREIDRFRNAFSFIKNYKRVVYLYGDVVYDKADLQRIMVQDRDAFLGRTGRNRLTKKGWDEIYAVVLYDIQRFIDDVNEVAHKFETGKIGREIGWEVYNNRPGTYQFVELSLRTDDYDTKEEYELVKRLYM